MRNNTNIKYDDFIAQINKYFTGEIATRVQKYKSEIQLYNNNNGFVGTLDSVWSGFDHTITDVTEISGNVYSVAYTIPEFIGRPGSKDVSTMTLTETSTGFAISDWQ